MVRSVQGGQDLQPRPALPHRLHQDQRGRPVRPWADSWSRLGSSPAGPQTAQQVGQPLRPVAQGQICRRSGSGGRRRGTDLPGRPAPPSGPGRQRPRCPGQSKAGWRSPGQRDPSRRAARSNPLSRPSPPTRFPPNCPGQHRRPRGPAPHRTAPVRGSGPDSSKRKTAASGSQVAHPPAAARRGKGGQPQGVLSQRKDPRRLTQEEGAQPFHPHTPASSKRAVKCRVIRPVSPQMTWPFQG